MMEVFPMPVAIGFLFYVHDVENSVSSIHYFPIAPPQARGVCQLTCVRVVRLRYKDTAENSLFGVCSLASNLFVTYCPPIISFQNNPLQFSPYPPSQVSRIKWRPASKQNSLDSCCSMCARSLNQINLRRPH